MRFKHLTASVSQSSVCSSMSARSWSQASRLPGPSSPVKRNEQFLLYVRKSFGAFRSPVRSRTFGPVRYSLWTARIKRDNPHDIETVRFRGVTGLNSSVLKIWPTRFPGNNKAFEFKARRKGTVVDSKRFAILETVYRTCLSPAVSRLLINSMVVCLTSIRWKRIIAIRIRIFPSREE